MSFAPLPLMTPLDQYDALAGTLLAAFQARDAPALRAVHHLHPRFRDPAVAWKPRALADGELEAAALDHDDARLVVARGHDFRDWSALATHVAAMLTPGSAVAAFEEAAEAVITGDLAALDRLLTADPTLARARSARVTCLDPAVHRATLLHYVGANGIEGHRQRTPADAVAITRRLLEGGAEPDALAGFYGGEHATMSMLVSSSPPAVAGLQVPLIHLLLDFGAAVDGAGRGRWRSNLLTALVFGFVDAAEALVARGAAIATVAIAAGLGRHDDVVGMLGSAPADDRHAALALAAQLSRVEIVRTLLDAGEDPDRFNPADMHAHATPLHHAAGGGHLEVVQLLVTRGARTDLCDRLWDATPLGWARHGGHAEVARWLEGAAASG